MAVIFFSKITIDPDCTSFECSLAVQGINKSSLGDKIKKQINVLMSFCIIAALVFCSLSCDSSSSDDIPEEVGETAAGVFEFVMIMLEDAPLEDGMSVSTDGDTETMTLTAFDTGEGFTVSGTVILTTNSTDPLDIEIAANLSTAGSRVFTCSMNGRIVWATGQTYEDRPQSASGTFTYNGETYKLADILNQS